MIRGYEIQYPPKELDEEEALRIAMGFRGCIEFLVERGKIRTILFSPKRKEMVELFRSVYKNIISKEVRLWIPPEPPSQIYVVGLSTGNGFTFIEPEGVNSLNSALHALSVAERAILQIIVVDWDWRKIAKKMASLLLRDAWAQRQGEYDESAVIARTLAREVEKKLHGRPLLLRIQGAIWGDPSPLLGMEAAFPQRSEYDSLHLYVLQGLMARKIYKEIAYRGIKVDEGSLRRMAKKRVEEQLSLKHLLTIPVTPQEIVDFVRLPSDTSLPIRWTVPFMLQTATLPPSNEGIPLGVII